MDLDYNLSKKKDYYILHFYVNEKKLSNIEFICYMQYEFFVAFFISVLNDISNICYKRIRFPVFNKNTENVFEIILEISTTKTNPLENNNSIENLKNVESIEIFDNSKYMNVYKKNNIYVFIPNKKYNNIMELISEPQKFQKQLKQIFDLMYLLLKQNDKNYQLFYKNNFFIMFLEEMIM